MHPRLTLSSVYNHGWLQTCILPPHSDVLWDFKHKPYNEIDGKKMRSSIHSQKPQNKIFRVNLIKEVRNVYNENYDILMKETV